MGSIPITRFHVNVCHNMVSALYRSEAFSWALLMVLCTGVIPLGLGMLVELCLMVIVTCTMCIISEHNHLTANFFNPFLHEFWRRDGKSHQWVFVDSTGSIHEFRGECRFWRAEEGNCPYRKICSVYWVEDGTWAFVDESERGQRHVAEYTAKQDVVDAVTKYYASHPILNPSDKTAADALCETMRNRTTLRDLAEI